MLSFQRVQKLVGKHNGVLRGNGVNLKTSLLEDSLTYGYLLPGFAPLHWRAMCVNARNYGETSRFDCAFETCECKREGHCFYDELCPTGEPFNGLGCYKDPQEHPCRECGYGEFKQIAC